MASLRPSVRFEVFKQDGFTCQYCGRQTPAVILEVDHIVPRALGGGDEIENLITACWDCNRGKGAELLDTVKPMRDMEEQAELILERERQLAVYNDAKRVERERKEREYQTVRNFWFEAWEETELERWHMPWESTVKHYIDAIGAEDVMEAMDIAATKFDRRISSDGVRYFVGILKSKRAEREGRVTNCTVCGKYITLTPEEAARHSAGWHHTTCEPVSG